MTQNKRLLIAMKPSKHRKLKVLAAKLGQTMNGVLQQILEYLLSLTKDDYKKMQEQFKELEAIAESEGNTTAFLVQQALREFIIKHTKKGEKIND